MILATAGVTYLLLTWPGQSRADKWTAVSAISVCVPRTKLDLTTRQTSLASEPLEVGHKIFPSTLHNAYLVFV